MHIGLLGMSGKPVHLGHWRLIEKAAAENDEVIVFVSLSDRARKGELTISGADMERIWESYLKPILPQNVEVKYATPTPIREIFELIGDEGPGPDTNNTYVIYSDPSDLKGAYANVKKYASRLVDSGRLKLVPVPRDTTVNVSGTMMRGFISSGDKESFVANLPPVSKKAAADIWKMLSRRMTESLLRSYISLLV